MYPTIREWANRRHVKTVTGFGLAIFLIALLFVGIGWERTLAQLRMMALDWVAVASLSSILCLVVWTKIWQVTLDVIDIPVSFRRLVVTYFAGTFANYVTPMGQTGGQPFTAYVLARDTDATYEQSLAIVISADLVRFLPFITFVMIGIAYLAGTVQSIASPTALLVVLVLVAVVPFVVIGVLWQAREPVRDVILRLLAPIFRRTSRGSLASIRARIDRLYLALELIVDAPRSLLVALFYGYAGWILFALPLYFSVLALGEPMSIPLVFVVVPAAVIAGTSPLPGGLATIEVTVVALLAGLTALTRADALAVTTIYRLTTYWLVVAIGGIAALWLIRRV